MAYLFIHYPKCSTCQNAKKWLDENHISYEERNIITETPTKEELKEWIMQSGYPIKKFFNTSGMLYREMGVKERILELKEEEKIALLASNGMLIKRPLLIGIEQWASQGTSQGESQEKASILVGFKKEEWEKIK